MKKILCAALAVSGIAAITSGIAEIAGDKDKAAASVSIIGSADGPTSIFLVGKIGTGFTLSMTLIGLLLLIAAAVLFFMRRK